MQGIPEMLVEGREAPFIRAFIDLAVSNPSLVPDADMAEYARHLAEPRRATAAFGYFRAFLQDAAGIEARGGER